MSTLTRDLKLSRYAEKNMRNWEIARAQLYSSRPRPAVADFITISNIVGAGGRDIALAVGEKLGRPVFDRDLLKHMADDDATRAELYRSMDERDLGWLEMTLRSLAESTFRKNDYFHRLLETVLCLARQSPAVFVGRSADLILPHSKGLRVKLIASLEYCAKRFAERNQTTLQQAREEVARIEAERRDFVLHHFHIDGNDPRRFDLLINVERFSAEQIVDFILKAHHDRDTYMSSGPVNG